MKFLCKVAGHAAPSEVGLLRVQTDGTGAFNDEYGSVYGGCPRCGERLLVGVIRLPRRASEERMLTAIGKAQAVLDAAHDEADAILKEACR